MKIKLVTFAPHPNFGTCLQSYALNKVLTDMGHDVEFIYNGKEKRPKPLIYYVKTIVEWMLPKQILNGIKTKRTEERTEMKDVPPYILELPNSPLRYWMSRIPRYGWLYKSLKCRTLQWRKVYKFTFEDGNYKMRRLYIKRQYDEVVKDADLFITGSDQIWNPYCGGFNPMMFLEFAGNTKRVAYSSSISRPNFPKEVELRAKEDLMKFQHIAVREQSSVDMLKRLLGRDDVQLVVDPTYLLSSDEWLAFGNRAVIEFNLPEKYIFCYFIGITRNDEYNHMVEEVKSYTGIQDVITTDCIGSDYQYGGGIVYKDGGPYEFVYLLSHASYVCMDSFHATVFSLKFRKDFVHILKTKENGDVTSQNTRMYDIMNRYNISHKIYDNNQNWTIQIDYEHVEKIMEEEINISTNYLKQSLS